MKCYKIQIHKIYFNEKRKLCKYLIEDHKAKSPPVKDCLIMPMTKIHKIIN